MNFTDEQLEVINARNSNILVSAAAGSGKTAVLVERIINMVLDSENPMDIDRLLVVTFTEAAALEMRERISKAIEEKLSVDPLNDHLQKQSALLYKAQISTIHSFCLNVIRNNFNKIGLDPSFRIADDTELKLLIENVLEKLLEKNYSDNRDEFANCVRYFSKGADDTGLRENILKLYNLADGYPWPDMWLEECENRYNITDVTELENSESVQYMMKCAHRQIESAINLANKALLICRVENGPIGYEDTIISDLELLEELSTVKTPNELRTFLEEHSFKKLASKVGNNVDESYKEKCKAIRESYKGIIMSEKTASLKNEFKVNLEDELCMIKEIRPVVSELISLTKKFSEAYKEAKLERGIISFSDMEHYALDTLYDQKENGGYIPSAEAIEYRNAFDEILMDEYQDCNRVQELLISAVSGESEGRFNRFMVGDVKQSIYKFRLASPELFSEKYNRYNTGDYIGQEKNMHRKIELHKNFRSSKNVVNTVNDLFSQIMHNEIGGVEYDDDARLVLGADYSCSDEENIVENKDTQLLFCVNNNDSNEDASVFEAQVIAKRIKELMKSYKVTDKDTGMLRPLKYKDIVILLRSISDVADGIKDVFRREEIPVYIPNKAGFYDTAEIQQIVQLLKVIDNPLQNIALVGAMKSFFGDFSDEEIARLKVQHKEARYLYNALLKVRDEDEKVKRFVSLIETLRFKSTYMPVHELLEDIIESSNYREYVAAMPGGAGREANIRLLAVKASNYEKTSFKGLFHFVKYLREVKAASIDEGEADVFNENADVVRVMTIHKSKGLEFPICFLAGVHKNFNNQDIKGNMLADMDFGLGISFIDLNKHIKKDTFIHKAIATKITQDILGEELRVLYVALTRAREKLIITGVIKETEKKTAEDIINEARLEHSGNDRLIYSKLSTAKNYADMLIPIYSSCQIIRKNELNSVDSIGELESISNAGRIHLLIEKSGNTYASYEEMKERIARKYSHENLKNMILKTSVSELKKAYLHLDDNEKDIVNLINADEIAYLSREDNEEKAKENGCNESGGDSRSKIKMSGTERGSAYHKVMELLDFSNKDIKSQINNWVKTGVIKKEWADAVPMYKIERFMDSELCERMAKAQKNKLLKKEQPFMIGLDAKRVKEEYPDDEIIILQGVIDAFFIEDNEIVLVDYKTDVINDSAELMERYHIQLDYYEEALEKIYELPIKESVLYSFCLGETVSK